MGESRDFVSLDWVQDDIEQTLQCAQDCFEAYLTDTTDKQQLTACSEAVHKVHGSLEMAGLPGALMLTNEIESLLNALLSAQIKDVDAAHDALAQALVHLPPYFSKVLLDGQEFPLLLLAPANQIRQLLAKDAIPEMAYFKPDLGPSRDDANQEVVERFDAEAAGNLKKLRQIYQFALIGIIRNEDVTVNLGRISNTLARLQQLCKGAPINQIWELGSALMEGLINLSIDLETTTIEILRGIDSQIKTLIEQGTSGLNYRPSPELMTGLLYFVAKSKSGSPHIDAIKHEYGLDQYKLAGSKSGAGLIAGPDKETIKSVVSALGEELERIKDTIDLYVRNEVKSAIDLGGLKPALNQIASTLVLLNLEAPRIVVQEQVNLLSGSSIDAGEISNETLQKVAESLLYVEAELDSVLASISSQDRDGVSVHANAAAESVVTECLASLAQAKESLQAFLSNDSDFEPLRSVPGVLRTVYGGLSIIALPTAPQLMFACAQYVEDDILALDKVPESGAMQTLAEIVSVVEIYLEDFAKSGSFKESVLEQAKQRIAGLGYPIEQSASINSESDQFSIEDLAVDSLEEQRIEADQQSAADFTTETAQVLEFPTSVSETLQSDASNDSSSEEVRDLDAAHEADDQSQEVIAEVSTELTEQQPVADESSELVDDEILEIFVEEAEEVFEEIDNQWPSYVADRSNQAALADVRRAFHTLKGSGRMVGAEVIGELSWAIENMLNHLIEGSVTVSDGLCDLVMEVRANMPELLGNFKQQTAAKLNYQQWIVLAERVIAGETIELERTGAENSANEATDEVSFEDQVEAKETAVENVQPEPEEESLVDIFEREARQHLEVVASYLDHAMSVESVEVSEEFYRALHTLKGSAHMADISGIAAVATAAEGLAKAMRDLGVTSDGQSVELFIRAKELMNFGLEKLHTGEQFLEGSDELLAEFAALLAEHPQLNPEESAVKESNSQLAQWLQQNMEPICNLQETFDNYRVAPSENSSTLNELHAAIANLCSGLDVSDAGAAEVAALLDAMSETYTQLNELQIIPSEVMLSCLAGTHEALIQILDQVAASQELQVDAACREQLLQQLEQEKLSTAECAPVQDSATEENSPVVEETSDAQSVVEEDPQPGVEAVADSGDAEELDPELIAIFLEEVDEIFETVAESKQAWMDDTNNVQAVDQLQRALHTLKGSSRMAGITSVGDLAHELESIYEDAVAGRIVASADLFSLIHECDDQLVDLISSVRNGATGESPQALITRVKQFHTAQLASEQAAEETEVIDTASEATDEVRVKETQASVQGDDIAEPVETPIAEQPETPSAVKASTQETVRVPAALLEQMVNLAGETSVSRSRVEQQVSNFGYAIDEIAATVERLREQLRRMEMETEAQILFRQEQEGPEHEGFDPLEMDRYSRMQELSRSLVESVSDLFDLKDTLRERSRYTESILLQQARINTELQEGLMKTRMVPFSRVVSRLRRVVRQVSGDVKKQVEFKLKNVDVELDRSLLEHMTAPLEHMLRNAVDHGIETPSKRKKQGKNESGMIELSLDRDGGDIVLTLSDDGAGVNIDKVRQKAEENGLIEKGAQLSDQEITQFILHAGFSTATKVTQISGRGVGMDVVSSEIKQLGGSINIESEPGKGSRFIVRVPFTVTVNSALMVRVADETYALPLSTIEGVVRVSPYELEEYYRENGPRFEYAGQQYDLNYLGDFVGHRNNLQFQNQVLPLPVILIRTAESAVALQVDDITASREIVVKPLGAQLGAMPGMSGATILGDGRVVLILDMPAMIRAKASATTNQPADDEPQAASESTGKLSVMVVDDSVTVRKVASRLLERHGMEVIVAKDGVEAMTKLQDALPSVMLLDIEMPRMDGFELASLMRHDERMKQVPIVMITSRTGEKHRERAEDIGVNKFMGKPFQEDDLLDAISELTSFDRNQKQANA